MAVAFDRREPTFRDALAETYKAGRPQTPEPLAEQIELIRRLVETFGVAAVDAEGYEADDVIATLATRLSAVGHEVVIVTGDRDAYQLVHDPLVKVLYNRRGVTDYVLYDEAGIKERTGVSPELYPFLAALRGDPSDNLPGVPGVGEKTAAKLVNTYGDVDSLYAHLGELTPKLKASLAQHEAQVRLNLQLTPLVRDIPLVCAPEDLTLGRSDREEMRSLLDLLEIRGPARPHLQTAGPLGTDRLGGAGGGGGRGLRANLPRRRRPGRLRSCSSIPSRGPRDGCSRWPALPAPLPSRPSGRPRPADRGWTGSPWPPLTGPKRAARTGARRRVRPGVPTGPSWWAGWTAAALRTRASPGLSAPSSRAGTPARGSSPTGPKS